jgi:uncharacterized membrane protein YuzA (DUF378 family)
MNRLVQKTKILLSRIGFPILFVLTFLLYLPAALMKNAENKSFRIVQMIWGTFCIAAMLGFFRYENLIASVIGIILGLAGVHQIWLGITGKSKKMQADSKAKDRNPLEVGKKLRKSYDRLCNEAFYSFKELGEGREHTENLEFEIAALLYFAFDFGMAHGEETETRNKIRDAFLEAKPINKVEYERITSRVEEYISALKLENDSERRQLLLGNVFAKHIGNANDAFVVSWAWLQYGAASKLANDLTNNTICA